MVIALQFILFLETTRKIFQNDHGNVLCVFVIYCKLCKLKGTLCSFLVSLGPTFFQTDNSIFTSRMVEVIGSLYVSVKINRLLDCFSQVISHSGLESLFTVTVYAPESPIPPSAN